MKLNTVILKNISLTTLILFSIFTTKLLSSDQEDGYVTPPENNSKKRYLIANECKLLREFKEGDLLYGLNNEARSQYKEYLDNKFGANALYTADRYNNKFLIKLENLKETQIQQAINSENNIVINEKMYTVGDAQKIKGNIIEYRDYIINNIKKDFFNEGKTEYELLKRFCKDAIKYIIYKKSKIHFLLDFLNVDKALNKTKPYAISYTSSELRFIQRNWDKFQESVIFYLKGEPIEAPWSTKPLLINSDDKKKRKISVSLINSDDKKKRKTSVSSAPDKVIVNTLS